MLSGALKPGFDLVGVACMPTVCVTVSANWTPH